MLTGRFAASLIDAAQPFGDAVPVLSVIALMIYLMSVALHYAAMEMETSRRSEVLAREAELRALKAQVNPHFLFNSLNSISALTSIDPGAARAMTLRLAGFFRQSLGLHADRKVPLSRELDLVREFLAIEQVRFGERLRFEADVTPEAAACLVPSMLLQPLVENAVKHGIGQMIEPGRIHIHAECTGSLLRIGVENDVDPDTPCVKGTGVGLENVRRRLAAAYGIDASTHWGRDGTRFRVELALPALTANIADTGQET